MNEDLKFWIIAIFGGLIGALVAYLKVRNLNKGFPAEDELSRRITERAGLIAFSYSLLLWIILLAVSDIYQFDFKDSAYWAVMSMFIVFIIARFVLKLTGVKDEK